MNHKWIIPSSFIFMSLFFFNYQLREQIYISYKVLKEHE